MDRLLAASINRPVRPVTAYVLTTVAIIAAAVVRAVFITVLVPWLLFIPVVLGCALAFGARPAAWGLALAAVLAAVSIHIPGEPYLLTSSQWAASLLFLLIGAFLVVIGQQLRNAFARADTLATEYGRALEISEERRERLAEREGFLSGILSSSSDCIKVLDLDGRLRFMSEGGQQVMEVADFGAIDGCPWESFWQGPANALARDAVDAARRGEPSSFTDRAATMAGNVRWWDVAVSPIFGADGQPERILSVSRDVTVTKTADEQVRLLNGELGHRLKNTLALVQAIASQTLKDGVEIADAREKLIQRLVALGRGADILTANSWEAADLKAVAQSVLAPHFEDPARLEIGGPDVRLSSRLGLSLSLALHELATNAAKYGALSNEAGKILLQWKIIAGDGPDGERLRLTWEEVGGPPVAEPTRKGFGTALIGRALSANFKGDAAMRYEPAGIVFVLDAPMATLNEVEHG